MKNGNEKSTFQVVLLLKFLGNTLSEEKINASRFC